MEGRFEDVFVLVDDDDPTEAWEPDTELRHVGRPAPRQDGLLRASGAAEYTVDVQLPGMLHAHVLRSPIAHGRLTSIDLDAARSLPGVRAVLGPASEVGFTGDPLLVEEPMYVGHAVAVVAADTPAQAVAALTALAPVFEPLAHLVDPDEALRDQRFTEDPAEQSRGDVESAWSEADAVVELELETPPTSRRHSSPRGGRALGGRRAHRVDPTQGMFDARTELARLFGLPREHVRVLARSFGGGFGGKQGPGMHAILAAELQGSPAGP